MRRVKQCNGLDLLGFGAHPDDVELTAGGLFLRMRKLGYRLGIVDCTRGVAGTRGNTATRAREAKAAARMLGLRDRLNLGLPDGAVEATLAAKRKVAALIRALRPLLIVAPYWMDSHPDHVAASRIVTDAVFMAGLRHAPIKGEPWRPRQVLYTMYHQEVSFQPSFLVDISDVMADKLRLAQCYASQFHNPNSKEPITNIARADFLPRIEARARLFGDLVGVEFAEGFLTRYPPRLDDPIAAVDCWRRPW